MASKIRQTDTLRSFCNSVKDQGYQGVELFEKIATRTVEIKEIERTNRCLRCWHDRITRCICSHIPPLEEKNVSLPIKVIILMHYKEYLSAGNDAKLMLALLPGKRQRSQLFVFGRQGEWAKFQHECSLDPDHTLLLWPAERALTVDGFISKLPADSPWRQRAEEMPQEIDGVDLNVDVDVTCRTDSTKPINNTGCMRTLPTLRVVVLDGVYSQARLMFKTIKRRFAADSVPVPPHVALHPKTLSVYHRAEKNYAQASVVDVQNSSDPDALHICSVEAFALLMKELGELEHTTNALVKAVEINNLALVHDIDVRPPPLQANDEII
jgi:DTW domain-containing protein YfiP